MVVTGCESVNDKKLQNLTSIQGFEAHDHHFWRQRVDSGFRWLSAISDRICWHLSYSRNHEGILVPGNGE